MATPLYNPLDDDLSTYGDIVSVEVFNGIATGLNYLIDSMPIGTIVPILSGFVGVPTPDSRLWKLCDGSVVTDQNSSLRDQATPDMRDRFMKNAAIPGLAGNTGGSNIKDLTHNHTGLTLPNYIGDDNADTDDDYITIYPHQHPVSPDLGPQNVEPVHLRVLHYIKIR